MSLFPRFEAQSIVGSILFVLLAATVANSQTVAPEFAGDYSYIDLGTPPGVTGRLGGLTLLDGDPNTLLIGGNANVATGTIFQIGLTRDAEGHIDGFAGSATAFASAPEIDGGLAYGPNGVLFYTGYRENLLGQILPGSAAPDKVVELGPLGVSTSVGALNFVAAGIPGAGELRLVTYNQGRFYTAGLTPDGAGTFDVGPVELAATIPFGPEGFVYVPPGSPGFADPSMLVSEFNANQVSAYELDELGIPIPDTRRDFILDLMGAEGAFIDPRSGDFLFSTFGTSNRVIVVRGFAAIVPEPAAAVLAVWGIGGVVIAAAGRRRANARALFVARREPDRSTIGITRPNARCSGRGLR